MKLLAKLTLTTALLIFASSAHGMAHGAIFTFKGIDGENLIMVTHNVHDAQAGAPITYNVRLYNLDGQLVPFQRMRARVLHGSRLLSDTTLPISRDQDVNLTYTYPKQGIYTLSVSFIDHDKQAAHSDFPIEVEKGVEQSFFASAFTVQTLAAFLLGAVACKLYAESKRHKLAQRLTARLRKKS